MKNPVSVALAAMILACSLPVAALACAPNHSGSCGAATTSTSPTTPPMRCDDPANAPQPQDGDIVFQRSNSGQAQAISDATNSTWTHVGVAVEHDGALRVLEARNGVEISRSWEEWRDSSRRNPESNALEYRIMRLADPSPLADPDNEAKLHAWADEHMGRPYDFLFQEGTEEIYCSELVHLLFNEIEIELGCWQRIRDLNLSAGSVRRLIDARRGTMTRAQILDTLLVSPATIAEDDDLVLVCENR